MGAEFNVGLSLLTFNYYLRLTYEPKYFTLTWTLDYQYSSDFGMIFSVACLSDHSFHRVWLL